MAKVEAKVIQDLLDQIEALEKAIKTAGDAGRAKLEDIKVKEVRQAVLGDDTKLEPEKWSHVGEDQQNKLRDRITMLRDSLHAAVGLDGPTDPKHIMYGEYASNNAIVLWGSIGFLLTALLLVTIVWQWEKATGTDFTKKIQGAAEAVQQLNDATKKETEAKAKLADAQRALVEAKDENTKKRAQQDLETRDREVTARRADHEAAQGKVNEAVEAIGAISKRGTSEASILQMVILLGALGGSLHLVGSLVMYVGNRQLRRSWLPYYLSTPVVGAALAPIVYMLLRVGILSPTGASTGGSNIAGLNLIGIYALAALTGLFGKVASDKLAEVFKTIFRSQEPPAKDPLASEKPPGGPAPAGGKSP
jgi:hypothetical protein